MQAFALMLAIVGLATQAVAAEPRRALSVSGMLAELARAGVVSDAVIAEDIDLARLSPPSFGGPPLAHFENIAFTGHLSGTPPVGLIVERGSICALEAERSDWPHPVMLRGVTISAMRVRQARFHAEWTCFECRVCRAVFEGARFDGEATFIGTAFGEAAPQEICSVPTERSCGVTNFAEASFAAIARFDRTSFQTPASFNGAEFAQSARFPRLVATAPLDFIGAHFRGDAEFRDCRLQRADFGAAAGASGGSHEASEFAARADFRGCAFGGLLRFDNAEFAGDALFSRASLTGDIASFRGVLGARSLDLRGLVLPSPQARLVLDATAADIVRLDWPTLGPAVLRGAQELPVSERLPMLESLEQRLGQQGDARAARQVGFEAEQQRRLHEEADCGPRLGACLASEVEWLLWTYPTRNGSDPTLLFAALILLWCGIAAASLPHGRLLIAARGEPQHPAPIYASVPTSEGKKSAYRMVDGNRLLGALSFATAIVLKLGRCRLRWARPASRPWAVISAFALRGTWLVAWALLLLVGKVLLTSFPGLDFIRPG
ncbi:hypothetical protein SAMN05519103_09008 [Rhizobiales bacterium GAS113]|nr:hypothetical protein SAMN05519103_09008 [Rhizobiales bacterium GAS113]